MDDRSKVEKNDWAFTDQGTYFSIYFMLIMKKYFRTKFKPFYIWDSLAAENSNLFFSSYFMKKDSDGASI